MKGNEMEQITRDAIQRECEQLAIEYARAIDFRDYDNFVELFTEDATLELGQKIQGKATIAKSLTRRPDELRSRHVITNVFVDVISETRARGMCYLTLYRHIGNESLKPEPVPFEGPAAVGHYEDTYQLTEHGWRIASRRLHMAFRNDAHF
jgi:3-phenylpropionate/cinnamic acid dioxygenase small subunit